MELRKLRGPGLDTFYARLRRCGDLACTGRPFIEHSNFPTLVIEPGDERPQWQQVAVRIGEAIRSGPDWVTHKVAEVAAHAGVSLNVKALRHYTASQLLAGGIDLRNTAARLGHGGGGATMLRHYADPVSEVDRRAAAYLAKLTAPPIPAAD